MSTTTQKEPSGFFQLEEVSTFQEMQGEQLAEVTYYFWSHGEKQEQRFLLYIELLFASDNALILTSGEDSDGLKVNDAMSLIQHARTLMERNQGRPAVSQLPASASALWQPLLGKTLAHIRLSKETESGLYYNDALVLDFADATGIMISLNERGGISVGTYA
jgi:hypothetical protein